MTSTKKQTKKAIPEKMGRRERRRIETREKLYRAAMKLFAERGFFETTTEAITEAADVGQGTFFNYFPTKAHVLIVLSEKQLEQIAAAQGKAEAGGITIREVFHKLFHSIVKEPAASHALTRSLLTAFVSHEAVRDLATGMLAHGLESLTRICEIGQKRGEINRRRKAADLAMTFQRSVLGTLLLWAMQSKSDLSDRLEKAFEDFWTAAEAKKDRTAR